MNDKQRLDFHGRIVDEPRIRAGFIGCGSHAFRNLYPTFQFAPVKLVATCDIDRSRADAFAQQFGADRSYDDHLAMLQAEDLDAVFICTNYDEQGRPRYPRLAADCLAAGCHAWIEKPPAASCADIDTLAANAEAADRHVMVGLKKMFFPANEKCRELMSREDFGPVSLAMLQYPQYVPPVEELHRYRDGENLRPVISFLDHLCHPVSLMLFLLGMPRTLHYQRSAAGAGVATFTFEGGAVASLALTEGACGNGGMERTVVISENGRQVIVDNNIRVTDVRMAPLGYGNTPSYYAGAPEAVSSIWEPEFSLGQLYNKGLFLLGYYGEINEFARAVLEGRPPCKATLTHARQVTQIFEAFAEGPGREIELA